MWHGTVLECQWSRVRVQVAELVFGVAYATVLHVLRESTTPLIAEYGTAEIAW